MSDGPHAFQNYVYQERTLTKCSTQIKNKYSHFVNSKVTD